MQSTPFESYKLYQALKFHFTQKKYDFIKFRGKIKTDGKTFDARNDKYFFHLLAKRYGKDLRDFYIANFATGDDVWIGDLLGEQYNTVYTEWLKRKQTVTKVFTEDVQTLVEFMTEKETSFIELITTPDGNNLPIIVRLFEQGYISMETIVFINALTQFVEKVDIKHPFWKDKKLLITKYQSFVDVSDLGKFASILRNGIDNKK